MGRVIRNSAAALFGVLMCICTIAMSDHADLTSTSEEQEFVDGGVDPTDGGISEFDTEPNTDSDSVAETTLSEQRDTESKESNAEPSTHKENQKNWRHDTSLRRRPGSYIGGVVGYAMGHAWYTTEQNDLRETFTIGPIHLQASAIRVGDAFFDWLTVGFQVSIFSMPLFVKTDADDPKLGGFGLYLDTTFYPWRGLGLRPSVGLGFSFAQDGPEAFQLGFGGPANLAFTLSYEFRVTRLFSLGPSIQVSWIAGENYDSLFLFIGLEILKWFKTAKG